MDYSSVLHDIEETEACIKSYCSKYTEDIQAIDDDFEAKHNKAIRRLWKKITNGMYIFYHDYQIKFEELSISVNGTHTVNTVPKSATEIDRQLINYIKFYDLKYYADTEITVNSNILKPEFTVYLPFINKYIFVKYISEDNPDNTSYIDSDRIFLQNTIYIHKNVDNFLIRYEFEMQLIKIIKHCLENNCININRQL
ncbi:MAG: hypothetical protein MJ153_05350 [Clostridia bacterium]|nr:hypothetical protein [Clostridia bacterium]